MFLLSREWPYRKPTLAFAPLARYTPADAQVPRHTAYNRRDAHPDRRDALASGGASPGAGGQRQAGALHRLRRTRLPACPHGPLRIVAGLHWRERIWRCHRTHPAQLQPQRRHKRLGRGYRGRCPGHWMRLVISAHSQTLSLILS